MDMARLEKLCDEALFFRAWNGTYELQMPSGSAITYLRRSFPEREPLITVMETKLGSEKVGDHFGTPPSDLFSNVSLTLLRNYGSLFPDAHSFVEEEAASSTPTPASTDPAEVARIHGIYWNHLADGVNTAASILTKDVQLRRIGLQYNLPNVDQVVFYDRLAQLINAGGISFTDVVQACGEVGYLPPDVHTDFVAELERGRPLEEAMAPFPDYFSTEFIGLVESTSKEGELDRGLRDYAGRLEGRFLSGVRI